jgi:hypothetical protein
MLAAVAGLGVLAAVAGVLYLVDPAEHRVFPICRFQDLTGLDCPGCGATRATHQLLHGRIGAAFYYNALYVALLPAGILWGAWWVRQWWRDRPLPPAVRRLHQWLAGGALASLLVFWVVRNCPGWPLM